MKGGVDLLVGKLWSRDNYRTLKGFCGIVLISVMVASAMIMIRLLGEQRFERILNVMLFFKRKPKNKERQTGTFVVDN